MVRTICRRVVGCCDTWIGSLGSLSAEPPGDPSRANVRVLCWNSELYVTGMAASGCFAQRGPRGAGLPSAVDGMCLGRSFRSSLEGVQGLRACQGLRAFPFDLWYMRHSPGSAFRISNSENSATSSIDELVDVSRDSDSTRQLTVVRIIDTILFRGACAF